MTRKVGLDKIDQEFLRRVLEVGNQSLDQVSLATGYFDRVADKAWQYLINRGLLRPVSGQTNRMNPSLTSYEPNI